MLGGGGGGGGGGLPGCSPLPSLGVPLYPTKENS